MSNRHVVIMAGGRGERFWPQSRLGRPKHLLPIVGDSPMLQQTLDRLGNLVPRENVWIITNREQVAAVAECCNSVPASQIVAEPVGRDTAAAVGLAALLIEQQDPGAAFAMLPADHVIHDATGLQSVLKSAFTLAEKEDVIVTVGIKPTHPATGYGYIRRGALHGEMGSHPVYRAEQFREKPDGETARAYLEAGEYFWNAGMFIWRPAVILAALRRFAPALADGLQSLAQSLQKGQAIGPVLAGIYPTLPKISIDFAVMEKADNVCLIPSAFDWDDVGEWPAVARHSQPDGDGNVLRGAVLCQSSRDNIVISEPSRLTVLVGVEGLIVVETEDATLICPREKAQEIKAAVARLGTHPEWKRFL